MIKTLKITGILAVVSVLALVFLLGTLALRGDEQAKDFLSTGGVIENFQHTDSGRTKNQNQKSPLVQEAHKFALRLNPPKPKRVVKPVNKNANQKDPGSKRIPGLSSGPPAPPIAKRASFRLMATCKYQLDPTRSLALLDLAAKGSKWFRQGEKVGHLTLQEIKDGSVVLYQNGKLNSEIFTPASNTVRSLLKSDVSSGQKQVRMPGQKTAPAAQMPALPRRTVSGIRAGRRRAQPAKPSPAQQEEALLENIAGIQQVMEAEKTKKKSPKADMTEEERLKMLDELFKTLVQEHEELKQTPPEKKEKAPQKPK